MREDASFRLRFYAALGLGLSLAHLSPGLISAGSPAHLVLPPLEALPPMAVELLLAGLLFSGLAMLRYREFRPWRLPARPRLGSAPWKRVSPRFPKILVGYSVLLLLASQSLLAWLAVGLSLWYYLGYQVWECELDGRLDRLYNFFGVQWSDRLPLRRAQAEPDLLAGKALLARRSSLPVVEGPRSDEAAYAARRRQAAQSALGCLGLATLTLGVYARAMSLSPWLAAVLVALPPCYILYRIAFGLLPTGVATVQLPQRRRLTNTVVECRPQGAASQLGCGILLLLFGGMHILGFLVVAPLVLVYLAAQLLELPGVFFVALTVLAALVSRLGPRPEKYYELEAGSRNLYVHDVRTPYQFTRCLGKVVALGISNTSLDGSLPIAYTSDGKHYALSLRGPKAERAFEEVSVLAASVLVPVVPPTLSTSPHEVCGWIQQKSLDDRLHPWPAPRRSLDKVPALSPPVD